MVAKKETAGASKGGLGVVPTGFAMQGPKTVPRIDYERIFVLDGTSALLGEYALNDECPLEFADLQRSVPVSGMRHLVSFYQGEYAFTPFRVDALWFVVLTRGVPRIEERGYLGTLLAAARIHIPASVEPALAKRELDLREREKLIEAKESEVARRESHVVQLDADLQATSMRLNEEQATLRVHEARLQILRDYALQIQRGLANGKADGESAKPKDAPAPAVPAAR